MDTKVLRVGIVQEGRIVQERLIRAGTTVTVGENPTNTFLFPKTHLPVDRYTLFESKKGAYTLHLTDKMGGKLRSNGGTVGIEQLRATADLTRRSGTWRLPLQAADRGKIEIDGVIVLFQFVTPPPVDPVKPIGSVDFRPRIVEDDDPVFLGFLAVWSALAVVFTIWIVNTEPTEFELEDLPSQFVQLHVDDEILAMADDPKEDEPEAEEETKTDEAKSKRTKKKAKSKKVDAPDGRTKVALKVKKARQAALSLLGHTGEGRGSRHKVFTDNDDTIRRFQKQLGKDPVEIAALEDGIRVSGTADDGPVDIAAVDGIGGGNPVDVDQVDVTMIPTVDLGSGDVDEDTFSGDKGTVKKVVRRYAGQLKYCYESRLKALPKLGGRVQVGWEVVGGRAVGVHVVDNRTGDDALADCIVGKVEGWRFPAEVEGDVSWPFLFRQKQ